MLEKMYKFLGWTNGQIDTFEHWRTLFKDHFSFKRIFALLLASVELFLAAAFKTGVHPYGKEIDLSNYTLVFADEFDGDKLDMDVWYTRADGPRRSGYDSPAQIQVKDGNLIITGEYRTKDNLPVSDDPDITYGEGWYAGAVALRQKYNRGYFEIRCICNDSEGFWSAFWFQGSHPYDPILSNGGVGSAEIDIFETPLYKSKLMPWQRNAVSHTIWCNGVDDDPIHYDKSSFDGIGKNIYKQYNTYGLEWNEDEYIFYINGRETGRTSFGFGTSNDMEELIISLEIPELPDGPNPKDPIPMDHSETTEYIIDYVRVYQ